jgi:DNA polymerase V
MYLQCFLMPMSLPENPFGPGMATLVPIVWPVAPSPVRKKSPAFLVKVPAGFPLPSADYAEAGLDLNDYLIRNRPATFLFDVAGDSMRGVGILDGDKIVVDRAIEARHGMIIVAIINGEHTVKRLHAKDGVVELRAENPRYSTIKLKEGEELFVFGVVVGVVRKLGS